MTEFRLLAIDIDGTLVNSRDELTPTTREALVRARDGGIQVVLATGRRYSRTLHLIEPLGIDVPLVTANGALIKHPADHRTLYQSLFDRQDLVKILQVVAEANYDAVLYGDTFQQGFDFYAERIDVDQFELAEFFALNPNYHRLWPNIVENPPPDIFAGFAMGPRDEMLQLEATLHRRLPNKLNTHVARSPRYTGYFCELIPPGVSKWSGIQHVAAMSGIPHAAICAVGDDVNDIPMIQSAGLGIAMGNASDQVKAAADRIAPCHNSDGLVAVVEWLLQSN